MVLKQDSFKKNIHPFYALSNSEEEDLLNDLQAHFSISNCSHLHFFRHDIKCLKWVPLGHSKLGKTIQLVSNKDSKFIF